MHYKVTTDAATYYIQMVSPPAGNAIIVAYYGGESYQVATAGMQFFDLMRKLLPISSKITAAEFNTQYEIAKSLSKE